MRCCQNPNNLQCGPFTNLTPCPGNVTPLPNASCNGLTGQCVVQPPTPTPMDTHTVTATPTVTPTRTPTSTPTNTPVIPDNIDPYKCYRVKPSAAKFAGLEVTLIDQFGHQLESVLKPYLLCNPAIMQIDGAATPTTPTSLTLPNLHITCYKIRDLKAPDNTELFGVPIKVQVRNHFGDQPPQAFDVMKSSLVCIPSLKNILSTPKK